MTMADQFDKSLLESPYEDRHRSSPSPLVIGTIVFGLVIVVGVGAAFVFRGGGASQAGEVDVPGSKTASTTTLDDTVEIVLGPVAADEQILYHPTILPTGWSACDVSENRASADKFCAEDDSAWVSVKLVDPGTVSRSKGVSAGVFSGLWLSDSDPMELFFPTSEHAATIVQARGLTIEHLLEIASSIPYVGDAASLVPDYELPLAFETLTEEHFSGVFESIGDQPKVNLERFNVTVAGENAVLTGFRLRGYWTPDAAVEIPLPRLVLADRPLVVGVSPDRGRGYAVWDQGGFGWRLEGNLTVEQVTSLARDIVAAMADFPRVTG
jgi:hypothetical protein